MTASVLTLNDDLDELQAGILRALASRTRLRFIHALATGPCEVRDLADALGLTQTATSQHLAALRAVGVVEAERDGRCVRYRISDPLLISACDLLRGVLVRRLSYLGAIAANAEETDRFAQLASERFIRHIERRTLMSQPEKLVILATHGPHSPELATIPFVMACAALASDVHVVMGFQGDAVCLMHNGEAETVAAAGFPPLMKLLEDYRELGGEWLVCGPCAKSRDIDQDLLPGAEIVAAARFVAEITSAKTTLTY